MKTKWISIFFILILINSLLSIILLIRIKNIEKIMPAANLSLIQEKLTYESENNKLPDDILAYTEKDTIILNDAINTRKIIFRIFPEGCMNCTDEIINMIKSKKTIFKNVIILSSYVKLRNYYIFSTQRNIKNKSYNIKNLPFAIEQLHKSYFFLIDSNNIANYFFIPTKAYPMMSKEYLNIIEEKIKLSIN